MTNELVLFPQINSLSDGINCGTISGNLDALHYFCLIAVEILD